MERLEQLTSDGFEAWARDAEKLEDIYFFLQTEVIPMACVWSLANARLGKQPTTVFQFAQDFMAHEHAVQVWTDRAREVPDWMIDMEDVPFQNHLSLYQNSEALPHIQEVEALTDGRPADYATISGLEASVISALGHARYNSLDGTEVITLKPIGPADANPRDWLHIAGDHVKSFVRTHSL